MDFSRARFNMVEQQIRPWDVFDTEILDMLFHVKREDFVSTSQRSLAFTDVELPLSNGTHMLQPKMEARMLQDLRITADDKVLEIGTGSGYVTALLSRLAKQVISIDCDAAMLKHAADNLKNAECPPVEFVHGNGLTGLPSAAPFNVIFVGGATPVIPDSLKQQLAIGGRMILAVGERPVMSMTLIQRHSESDFSIISLYETWIEPLQGSQTLEPSRFVF